MIVGMSGCVTAQNTRLPSWYTWFPAAENEAYVESLKERFKVRILVPEPAAVKTAVR